MRWHRGSALIGLILALVCAGQDVQAQTQPVDCRLQPARCVGSPSYVPPARPPSGEPGKKKWWQVTVEIARPARPPVVRPRPTATETPRRPKTAPPKPRVASISRPSPAPRPVGAVAATTRTPLRPSWQGLPELPVTALLPDDLLDIEGQYIVDFNLGGFTTAGLDLANIPIIDLAARLGLQGDQIRSVQRQFLRSAVVRATADQMAALSSNPLVATVHASTRLKAAGGRLPLSWGLDRLDSPSLPLDGRFDRETGNYSARIYLFDSGALPSTADFGKRIITRANFTRREADDLASCAGHGTEMASLIMGRTTGSAPKAELVDVVVLPCERDRTGDSGSLVEAVEWLLVTEQDTRDGRPIIANMSLIGKWSRKINDAVATLTENGVVVVVAAGNNAEDACRFSPASAKEAVTVAATGPDDETPGFSNFGPCVKVNAPGLRITAVTGDRRAPYAAANGTSGAAALVSGVLARSLKNRGVASAEKWLRDAALPSSLWRKTAETVGLAQVSSEWRKLCRTAKLADGNAHRLFRTPGGKPVGSLPTDALVRVDRVIPGWALVSTLSDRKGWAATVTAGSPAFLQPDADVICSEAMPKGLNGSQSDRPNK